MVAENELNSSQDSSDVSNIEYTKSETVVGLLQDSIEEKQRKNNPKGIPNANIGNDVIINGSLNHVSQKLTLNER